MPATLPVRIAVFLAAGAIAIALTRPDPVQDSPAPTGQVVVEFRVLVPSSTPPDGPVSIAGSDEALGGWKPENGLPLQRGSDGIWTARARLPRGSKIEFKVTRGSWLTVERDPQGQDIPNRHLVADRDQTVDVEVASWAGPRPPRASPSLTGRVRFHEFFRSDILGNRRRIAVYLPPDYGLDPWRRYPVLYLSDGQNVFDSSTSPSGVEWGADEAAERLITEKKIPPLIIVAVGGTNDRVREYTPSRDADGQGGQAADYARFLVEELMPFIDASYPTLEGPQSTAIGGSSLGGLVALEIARLHPDRFGLCAALSPSLWWDDARLLRDLEADPRPLDRVRLWLDTGDSEGDDPAAQIALIRRLEARLQAAGKAPDRDLEVQVTPSAHHDESAWSARFPAVLEFLFGASAVAEPKS